MKNTLILRDKKRKSSLSPLQKMFDGRKKKVETLRKKCEECIRALDRHLDFYQKELYPKEKELVGNLKTQIKMLSSYLQDKKNFNKEQRNTLKRVILDLFEQIALLEDLVNLDEELCQIYEKVKGSSLQQEQFQELADFKSHIENLFAGQGKSVDLSDLSMEGTTEEMIDKIFSSLEDQDAFSQEKIETNRSEKQTEKEQKALERESLQKKAINTIYKQLAKVFHPDLELDPVLKLEKQALMQQLTAAYAAGDLHTILRLEVEHLDISESQKKAYSDDQLKTYNQLLQNQIEMIQIELNSIPFRPQYSPLHSYPYYFWERGEICLMEIQRDLQKMVKNYQRTIDNLHGNRSIQIVKGLIREQERAEKSF